MFKKTSDLTLSTPARRLHVFQNDARTKLEDFFNILIGVLVAEGCRIAELYTLRYRLSPQPRGTTEGAPTQNQLAMRVSKIRHPKEEVGIKGHIGLPHK